VEPLNIKFHTAMKQVMAFVSYARASTCIVRSVRAFYCAA